MHFFSARKLRKFVVGELSKRRIKWKIKGREMKREKDKREVVWKNVLTFTKKENNYITMKRTKIAK